MAYCHPSSWRYCGQVDIVLSLLSSKLCLYSAFPWSCLNYIDLFVVVHISAFNNGDIFGVIVLFCSELLIIARFFSLHLLFVSY